MPLKNYNSNKEAFPWMGQVRMTRPDGKQVIRRKQCKTKKEAAAWEAVERERLARELAAPQEQEMPTISLLAWATAYLSHVQATQSEVTYDEKRRAFRMLFASGVQSDAEVEKLTPLAALKYCTSRSKSGSGYAANKDRKNFHAAWEWGIRFLGMPEKNPFSRVTRFAEQREPRRVPTLDEFMRVFEVASTDQDRLMLWAYLQTGARRSELFRLQWKDVDLPGKRLQLTSRKNSAGEWRAAWLPISDELVAMLRRQQLVTGFLGFVFLDQSAADPKAWVPYQKRQHWLGVLCKRAGVEPFGLHGIRHLTASLLAGSAVPMVSIKDLLRHQNLTTTQRYIHSLQKENRGVLDALPVLEKPEKHIKSTFAL